MKDSHVVKTKLGGGPNGEGNRGCVRNRSRRGKGRWTREEHESFLKGVELHGKDWKAIGDHVRSRTVVQIRTHAQKYFLKADKGIAFPEEPYLSTEDEGVTDSSGSSDSESAGPSSAASNGNSNNTSSSSSSSSSSSNNNNNSSSIAATDTAGATGSDKGGNASSEANLRLNSLPIPHPARGKRLLRPAGTDAAGPICSLRTTRGRAAAAAKAAAEAAAAKAAAESASAATDVTVAGGSTIAGSTRDVKRMKLDVHGAFGGISGRIDDPHGLLVAVDGRRGLGGVQPREKTVSVGASTPFAATRDGVDPVAVATLNTCGGVSGDMFSQCIISHRSHQPHQQSPPQQQQPVQHQPSQQQPQSTQPRQSSGTAAPLAAPLSAGLIPWASPLCIGSDFGHYSTGVSVTTVNVHSASGVADKTTETDDIWSATGSGVDINSRGALAVAVPSKLEPFVSTPTGGSPFNLEYIMDSFQSDEGDERFNAAAAAAATGAAPGNSTGISSLSSPLTVTPHSDDVMTLGASVSGISDAASQRQSSSLERQSPGSVGVSTQAYFPLKTASAWPMDSLSGVTTQPSELDLDGVTTATAVTPVGSRCMMEDTSGTAWCCGDTRNVYGNSAAKNTIQDCGNPARETLDSKVWRSAGEAVVTVNPVTGDSQRSTATCASASASAMAPVNAHVTASSPLPCLASAEVMSIGSRADISGSASSGPVQDITRKSLLRHSDLLYPFLAGGGGGSGRADTNISSQTPREGKPDLEEPGHTIERGLTFVGVGRSGDSDGRNPETNAWMEVTEAEERLDEQPDAASAVAERTKNDDIVAGSQMFTGGLEQCALNPQPVAGWLGYAGDVSASAASQQLQMHSQDPASTAPTCTAAPVAEPLPGVDLEAEDGLLMFLSEDYFGML